MFWCIIKKVCDTSMNIHIFINGPIQAMHTVCLNHTKKCFFNKQTNPFSYTDTVSTILHFSILHFSIIHFSLFSVVKTLRDQKLFLSLFENMVPKQHFQISSVAMPTTCTTTRIVQSIFMLSPSKKGNNVMRPRITFVW